MPRIPSVFGKLFRMFVKGEESTNDEDNGTNEVSSDLLSTCPSLVHILSFLQCKDIENCKMVNTRLNDVIQRNMIYFDRPYVYLNITVSHKENCLQVKVRIKKRFNSSRFYAVTLTEDNTFFDHEMKWNERGECVCPGHPSKGLSTELANLSFRFFRQFYFRGISVEFVGNAVCVEKQEELMNLLATQFTRTRSKCYEFAIIGSTWKAVRRIHTSLDAACAKYYRMSDVGGCFTSVSSLTRNLFFSHMISEPTQRREASMIPYLIKKWEDNDIVVSNLNLLFVCLFDCKLAFTWRVGLLFQVVTYTVCFDHWMIEEETFEDGLMFRMGFKRKVDNRALVLKVRSNNSIRELHCLIKELTIDA